MAISLWHPARPTDGKDAWLVLFVCDYFDSGNCSEDPEGFVNLIRRDRNAGEAAIQRIKIDNEGGERHYGVADSAPFG